MILCLFTSCADDAKKTESFRNTLGVQKSAALDELIYAFDNFLELRYPKVKDNKIRTELYLKDIIKEVEIDYSTPSLTRAMELLESTGLRIDLYIHKHEYKGYKPYNPWQFLPAHVTKTSLMRGPDFAKEVSRDGKFQVFAQGQRPPSFNIHGLFLYAYAKAGKNDEYVMDIVEARWYAGQLGPIFKSGAYLSSLNHYDKWYYKMGLVVEVYLSKIMESGTLVAQPYEVTRTQTFALVSLCPILYHPRQNP
ncbi:MAG: hypothetical protein Roseis2KO_31630 [Roseivirga sp.]